KDLKSFPTKRQGVAPPARGEIVVNYGDPGEDGIASQGIVIETRGEAQVVAPHDGQVVFRGPFRGYGEILIIEHRGGYHTLLAGLGRTDAVVGQWLLAGEPVGTMDFPREHKPRLYVELRRGGRPINPWPWLEARISKVE
ncbi:MAG: murein hydrolase activator EnvC family protein, partial [Dongiaceae bacterium]